MNILFDIGATKTRVTKSNSLERFETPIVYSTPDVYEDGLKALRHHISNLKGKEDIDSIIGCIAGPWNESLGAISQSGNLSDWDDKPLKIDLEQECGAKVHIDNDAAVAGLGEAIFGAGKGYLTVLYVTVSTGIGGAIIHQGTITERLEPRHIVVTADGETLGRLVSGRSIEKKMGTKPQDIHDQQFWDDKTCLLAKALAMIISEYSPDCVVLGGSMMNPVGIDVKATNAYVREILTTHSHFPLFKHSALGDFGGLYGALASLQIKK